eukprot:3156828-Alexandrium_andersonii.AAC.1
MAMRLCELPRTKCHIETLQAPWRGGAKQAEVRSSEARRGEAKREAKPREARQGCRAVLQGITQHCAT